MTGRLEVGGLALVIRCAENPEMVGKCVTLERRVAPGEAVRFGGMSFRPAKDVCWIVSGDGLQSFNAYRGNRSVPYAGFAERNLMPLRGDEQPQLQRVEELTT